jgi:hypothetical protein
VTPIEYEHTLVRLMREFEKRKFDDTTAEQAAQWQLAADHLGHAANCMSILDAIEKGQML